MENVVMRRCRWLVLALVAALLVGPLLQDGYAKKPKTFFKVIVNGRKLKATKPSRGGILASTSFSVSGSSKLTRGVARTIQVNCGPVDLGTVPPGTTLTGCFGGYTEAGKTGSFRQWTGTGMELTVDAFDGSRVSGSFHGVLVAASSANPSDAAAVIEEGVFSVILLNFGV